MATLENEYTTFLCSSVDTDIQQAEYSLPLQSISPCTLVAPNLRIPLYVGHSYHNDKWRIKKT